MMPVDHVAEHGESSHGIDQGAMAQHRFTHVGNQDVGDDAETGHDGDVDFGMSEKPEQVLPQQGRSARVRLHLIVDHQIRCDKKAGSGHMIENDENTSRH